MPFSTPFTPYWLKKARTNSYLNSLVEGRELKLCECCNRKFEGQPWQDLCCDCQEEGEFSGELAY